METNDLQDTAGRMTDPSGAVVFDTSSGISLEEQQEILAGINAMAGGSRLVPEHEVMETKKRGFFFPLFVNIGAVLVLGLGFVLLSLLHGQDEQSIRESSFALGLTERKLIQEIRQDTKRQISEKENEINDILSKLFAVDAEYRQLQVSVESLTEEQRERAALLLSMQEEYRGTLAGLQEEKAEIIEKSRQQEADLRAHAEKRAEELSSQIEQNRADLSAAAEELRRLGSEQEKASRAESQMSGYYAVVNEQINSGRLDEASGTLGVMKEFLAAPSLRGIRSVEARKETHLAAIAALEGIIAEARRLKEEAAERNGGTAGPAEGQGETIAALEAEKAALEEKIGDQEAVIAAYRSEDSEQGNIIAAFETRISELTSDNNELASKNINQQETLNRRDSEIVTLREERERQVQTAAGLNENIAALTRQNETLQRDNAELQRQMDIVRQAMQALTEDAPQ